MVAQLGPATCPASLAERRVEDWTQPVLGQIAQPHQRAQAQAAIRQALHAVEPRQPADVHQRVQLVEAMLRLDDDVGAPGTMRPRRPRLGTAVRNRLSTVVRPQARRWRASSASVNDSASEARRAVVRRDARHAAHNPPPSAGSMHPPPLEGGRTAASALAFGNGHHRVRGDVRRAYKCRAARWAWWWDSGGHSPLPRTDRHHRGPPRPSHPRASAASTRPDGTESAAAAPRPAWKMALAMPE